MEKLDIIPNDPNYRYGQREKFNELIRKINEIIEKIEEIENRN